MPKRMLSFGFGFGFIPIPIPIPILIRLLFIGFGILRDAQRRPIGLNKVWLSLARSDIVILSGSISKCELELEWPERWRLRWTCREASSKRANFDRATFPSSSELQQMLLLRCRIL